MGTKSSSSIAQQSISRLVRWRLLTFPYREGVLISGEHDLAPIARQLWSRLSSSLEKCEFDYWGVRYYELEGEELESEIAVQARGPDST